MQPDNCQYIAGIQEEITGIAQSSQSRLIYYSGNYHRRTGKVSQLHFKSFKTTYLVWQWLRQHIIYGHKEQKNGS